MSVREVNEGDRVSNALVIYHGDCYDGFTAAWIAHAAMGGSVDLFPGKYGERPPWEMLEDRDVYILDFSYSRTDMLRIDESARSLVVLDHHKTAEENCRELGFCTFDMNRSGAGMAWDYFFPGKDRPQWIQCVEDRDLWRFSCSDTKNVHAYLTSVPMTILDWYGIHSLSVEEIVQGGKAIRASIDRYCEKMAEHSRGVIAWGVPADVVNAPYLNCSELCNYLLEGNDEPLAIAVAYFQRNDGRWQFSLRGKPGGTDVSLIAREFGGGGHYSAAGFDLADLTNWKRFPPDRSE